MEYAQNHRAECAGAGLPSWHPRTTDPAARLASLIDLVRDFLSVADCPFTAIDISERPAMSCAIKGVSVARGRASRNECYVARMATNADGSILRRPGDATRLKPVRTWAPHGLAPR